MLYGTNVGGRTPPLFILGGRMPLPGRFIGGNGLKLPPGGGVNMGGLTGIGRGPMKWGSGGGGGGGMNQWAKLP
ncbi:MAG: hypothetical protein E7090_03550 [Bacteroidales bacterium]|nr:hypothetical protein [Bacteroidales bacterium]